MSHHVRSIAALLLFLFVVSLPIFPQQLASGVRGRVTDELGGIVVGATVIITGVDNRALTATTDGEGIYSFNNLAPGRYAVRVVAGGFAVYEKDDVNVVAPRRTTLDVQLAVTLEKQDEVTVNADEGLSTDANENADALVLKGSDIDALPSDPDSLSSAIQALAGPSAGAGGAQVFVDGFSSGRLPPKESIREVRVSQNPLNAEYDRPGFGRVDILTKPGTDKLRGSAFFNFSDESLNSRNPFARERAPFQSKLYGGTLSGTVIKKRASFFIDFQRRDVSENAIVSARVLDDNLNFNRLGLTVLAPTKYTTVSPRFDYQLNQNHTLVGRYTFTESSFLNQGVGELTLPERAFDSSFTQHTFQLTETAVLGPTIINETRFQFMRDRRRQSDRNSAPGIIVQDAFLGGGPGVGLALNTVDRYELQNYTTATRGNHVWRYGVRLRGVRLNDVSPGNFNGTYIFAGNETLTSLEQYQRTLVLQRQGLSPAQIRAAGGGATQFTISGGEARARVSQIDFGGFAQDEWKIRPNFTLTLGLRYETQTNINSNFNFAPRVLFAWAPGANTTGTWGGPGGGGGQPKTVFRGGFGIFYDRFNENYVLQATRYDGASQLRFNTIDPLALDSFPGAPTVEALQQFAQRQTISRVAANFEAPHSLHYVFSAERQLPGKITAFVFAFNWRTRHATRLRNINAPLPGTFQPEDPQSGVRPFGDVGEIYQYESSANLNLNQFVIGARSQLSPAFSLFTNYVLSKATSDADFSPFGGFGSGSFPANSYDLSGEYGRASFDVRHRFFSGGTIEVPKLKLTLNPFVIAFSSRPFNITTGIDANGDRLFTERPALAGANTALENLRRTRFGDFDLDPAPGQPVIPRNYGQGPSFFAVNLNIGRTFAFGDAPSPPPAAATAAPPQNPSGGQAPAPEKRYKVTLSVQIQNLLNRTNLITPIGNLSSPLFGQSTRTLGAFDFGNGGGGGPTTSAANRRVDLQLRFNF